MRFMDGILNNIAVYLDNEDYLERLVAGEAVVPPSSAAEANAPA
jgi:hypothetical protein